MKRKTVNSCRTFAIQITMFLCGLVFITLGARAGSPDDGKATPPPPNWEQQWAGNYGGEGLGGKDVPKGFASVNPYMKIDEVIASHLKPWALARRDATEWDLEDTGATCKLDGIFRGYPIGGFEFIVSPGRITLIPGGIENTGIRRIYMNRGHLKNPPLTWNGDSVGHWEGDTLVIDTTGFNDRSWLSSDREPHSEQLHVVERNRFVADGTYLEVVTTVEDPVALTSPYTYTRYHKKLPPSTVSRDNVCNEDPFTWRRRQARAAAEQAEEDAAAAPAAAKGDTKKDAGK
jgi:hypothetical protein